MRYRPEIDGLRAVAIVPVVLFHAGSSIFSGGFVGVDVFFVISGFLITSIIASDIESRKFSIVRFYDRRIRRIFPAFVVVTVATIIVGSLLLLPTSYSDLSKSIIYSIFFVSNIYFYKTSGYFAADADTKPFLHTWSLSVEEQFYVIFPFFLFIMYRYARRLVIPVVVLGIVLSFVISAWGAFNKPTLTFFLLPTRAWELMIGAALAIGVLPPVSHRLLREILSMAGLLAIVAAATLYTVQTPFPGAAAAVPVLGAALIIYCSAGTLAGRLLASPPAVFIGLVSYSLYLWHWPIIVFTREYLGDLNALAALGTIAASFLCAILSWRYVERPFRARSWLSTSGVFGLAAAAMSVLVVVSVAGIASQGWRQRFPADVLAFADYERDYSPRRSACHSDNDRIIAPAQSCVFGADVTPRFVVWGDSHAVELAWALGGSIEQGNNALMQISSSSCPPIIGYESRSRAWCKAHNAAVIKYIAENPDIDTVFLAARWEVHFKEFSEPLGAALNATVRQLHAAGKKVVVIYSTPVASQAVPRALAKLAAAGRDLNGLKVLKVDFMKENEYAIRELDKIDPLALLGRIRPEEIFCDGDACLLLKDGKPILFDDNHLSVHGAGYLAAEMARYVPANADQAVK